MIDVDYYPPRYLTAESRVLYLTGVKGYGSILNLAEDIGVVRSYLTQCLKEGIPLRYANYLATKFVYPVAVLKYETFILFQCDLGKGTQPYKSMFERQTFFNSSDQRYILSGTYVTNPVKFLRAQHKAINGK